MANDLVPQPGSLPGLRQRFKRGKDNQTKIAGHLSRLMSHFWVANEDPRLRGAQAEDWLDDLSEFHEAVVGEACRDWRQVQTRRPTPAEIRLICMEKTVPYAPEREVQSSPHPFPSNDDYHWLKGQEGQEHSEEDWRRIKAYQLAWERVQGREAADPEIWEMIDAAEKLMSEAARTA